MDHKKAFPQDSMVNEISANCWEWPDDDQVPVDLSTYDLSYYSKQGLSQVKAVRRLPEDIPEYWKKRNRKKYSNRSSAIQNLLKGCLPRSGKNLTISQSFMMWRNSVDF